METDQIERLLAHDPLMCHYTVTAKDELPEIVETYQFALVCIVVDEERGDYFDPYG